MKPRIKPIVGRLSQDMDFIKLKKILPTLQINIFRNMTASNVQTVQSLYSRVIIKMHKRTHISFSHNLTT